MRRHAHRARAFATILVFSLIVFAAILLTSVQASSLSQAGSGREALARVRAQWAARAGVEMAIARLESLVEEEENGGASDDAFLALEDMASVAQGDLDGASWEVLTQEVGEARAGPMDAASLININRATREQLLEVEPLMTEDQIDAVLDWIDSDDDTRELGAEAGYYAGLPGGLEPRNGPMRSIAELELVAGIDPAQVRGEDWNLNGVLDPNEDDGDVSWPPDNRDGILDRGWSGVFTVHSVENTRARSGKERLDLQTATQAQVQERVGCTTDQAQAVVDWAAEAGEQLTLGDFVAQTLPTLARTVVQRRGGSRQEQLRAARLPDLSREQLAALVDECSVGPAAVQSLIPGRLNINTCEAALLETLSGFDPAVADAIVAERSAKGTGFASVVDLLDVPEVSREVLAQLLPFIDVRSSVYVVASKGRDANTGLEVEMVATVDASRLPAAIRELHVR